MQERGYKMSILEDLDKDVESRLNRESSPRQPSGASIIGAIATLPFIIVLVIFIASFCIARIPAGHVGVKYSVFGGVQVSELPEGWHLKWPWVSITLYSVRTQDYTMSITQGEGRRAADDRISALTSEGLNVDLDISVLFKIDATKADELHKNVGPTYDNVIIRPNIRSIIREVVARYTAAEVYSEKREDVAVNLKDKLLVVLQPKHILIENVLLRSVVLPQKLRDSIEEKQTAEQRLLKMNFVLQEQAKEAERKVIEATGHRNATIVEAEGQALAIKKIQEQLGVDDPTSVLGYYYIQTLKESDIQTVIVPTDSGVPVFLPSNTLNK